MCSAQGAQETGMMAASINFVITLVWMFVVTLITTDPFSVIICV